jgi:hypothetical protein
LLLCGHQQQQFTAEQIASFAPWKKEQGSLLHQLTISAKEEFVHAWEQLISTALQPHNTSTAAGTQHSSAPAAARLPLGQASVSWYRLQTPVLLHALQSAPRLTDLQLLEQEEAAVTPGMLAALGRLTTLHSLAVSMPYQHKSGLPPQFAGAVGNLSCLTQLEFRYLKEGQADSLRLLPTSLCELK